MKTRNVLLGLAALILAMGSAFATKLFDSERAFIEVKLSPTSDWSCEDSGVDCDDEGDQPCKISIATTVDNEEEVSGRLAGMEESCGAALLHTSNASQPATIGPVYDAR